MPATPTQARTAPAAPGTAIRWGRLRAIGRSMRPRQWLKNGFVVAPALFGQTLTDPDDIAKVAEAVACFCAISSGLYLFNDVIDREQDRHHPRKRLRPVAAGELSVRAALTGSAVLVVAALAGAALVAPLFLAVVAAYGVLTVAYSLVLKYEVILDVMAIAGGFVLRVAGGAAAVDVEPSVWIFICTGSLALLLAFGKRRHEGASLTTVDPIRHRRVLADYSATFVEAMMVLTAGATLVAYAVYTASEPAASHHLAASLPFVVYGVIRYLWLVLHRHEGESPTALVWEDRPLQITIVGWVVAVAILLALT